MARKIFPRVELDENQKELAERIYQRISGAFEAEARRMAELMASKATGQIFGATEFELRDRVHELGAAVLEAAAQERVKKGGVSRS